MLSLSRLHKTYPGPAPRSILQDVNLELSPGDYIAIVGDSGCGKSTLLNLIAGLDLPDSGSVKLHNREITGLDDNTRTRMRRRYGRRRRLPSAAAAHAGAFSCRRRG